MAHASVNLIVHRRRRISGWQLTTYVRCGSGPTAGNLLQLGPGRPRIATAAAAQETLFLPCARGRVHPQRQGGSALRVRHQGLCRHHQRPRAGRPVRAARSRTACNHYDVHSLGTIIEATETLTGCAIERAYVDKGCRGHNTDIPRRVFISGQKRGVFGLIERELRRRVEPIIGHMKSDGHLGRCHRKGRESDASNVILTAVGHNLGRVIAWPRDLLTSILIILWQAGVRSQALKPPS